jgi:hypothetical protein
MCSISLHTSLLKFWFLYSKAIRFWRTSTGYSATQPRQKLNRITAPRSRRSCGSSRLNKCERLKIVNFIRLKEIRYFLDTSMLVRYSVTKSCSVAIFCSPWNPFSKADDFSRHIARPHHFLFNRSNAPELSNLVVKFSNLIRHVADLQLRTVDIVDSDC